MAPCFVLSKYFYLSSYLPDLNDTLSDNDTVGQIVHYIMKNEGMCPTNTGWTDSLQVFLTPHRGCGHVLTFLTDSCLTLRAEYKITTRQAPNARRFSVWRVNFAKLSAALWWVNVCTKIVMPKCVLVLFMGVCFCPLLSVLAFDAHPLTYTTICVFTHWPPCVLLVLHHSLLYRISACSSLSCSCWSTGSPP